MRGVSDLFVAVYEADGSRRWSRTFAGSAADWPVGVEFASEGSLVVAGQFNGEIDLDPGPGLDRHGASRYGDLFFMTIGADGTRGWARVLRSPDGSGRPLASDLALAPDGAIVLGGTFQGVVDFDPGPGETLLAAGPIGSEVSFVASYSPQGDLRWAHALAGPYQTAANGIAVAADGTVYAAGMFTGASDLDPGPTTEEHTGAGESDAYVVAFGSAGDYRGALSLGGPGPDVAIGVAVAGDGSLVLTGGFSVLADLDPGLDVDEHTAVGGIDTFVVRLPASEVISASQTQ
jgi:hypothetical protein